MFTGLTYTYAQSSAQDNIGIGEAWQQVYSKGVLINRLLATLHPVPLLGWFLVYGTDMGLAWQLCFRPVAAVLHELFTKACFWEDAISWENTRAIPVIPSQNWALTAISLFKKKSREVASM